MEIIGRRHDEVLQEARRVLGRYQELRDIISMLGMEELSAEDRRTGGPRAAAAELLHAALPRDRVVHGTARDERVPIETTVGDVAAILDGRCDGRGERELFMIGSLDRARRGAGPWLRRRCGSWCGRRRAASSTSERDLAARVRPTRGRSAFARARSRRRSSWSRVSRSRRAATGSAFRRDRRGAAALRRQAGGAADAARGRRRERRGRAAPS